MSRATGWWPVDVTSRSEPRVEKVEADPEYVAAIKAAAARAEEMWASPVLPSERVPSPRVERKYVFPDVERDVEAARLRRLAARTERLGPWAAAESLLTPGEREAGRGRRSG
jgi:hypothetical protein